MSAVFSSPVPKEQMWTIQGVAFASQIQLISIHGSKAINMVSGSMFTGLPLHIVDDNRLPIKLIISHMV